VEIKNKFMNTIALRILLLVAHFMASAIIVSYIGDIMSQNIDMGSLFLLGLSISLIIVSIIKHAENFLLYIKNKNTKL
jgi:hypothetical protein